MFHYLNKYVFLMLATTNPQTPYLTLLW